MTQLRAGDSAAAAEVFNRFAERLLAVAQRRLRSIPEHRKDPEGVVDSMLASFVNRIREGRFPEVAGWDSLLTLLIGRVIWRCNKARSAARAGKRDFRIEQPVAAQLRAEQSSGAWEPVADDQSPSEVAVMNETFENLNHKLDDVERKVLAAELEGYAVQATGYSAREIAEKLGCTQRTVYRTCQTIEKLLREEEDD
jgi:DNA-directed RNA polymerase specialized sigma24 family protein